MENGNQTHENSKNLNADSINNSNTTSNANKSNDNSIKTNSNSKPKKKLSKLTKAQIIVPIVYFSINLLLFILTITSKDLGSAIVFVSLTAYMFSFGVVAILLFEILATIIQIARRKKSKKQNINTEDNKNI